MVPDRMKYIDYTDPYLIEYASFMLSMIFELFCFIHCQVKTFISQTSQPPSVAENSSTSSNIHMDREDKQKMTFRENILKIILALFTAILSTTLFLSLISKASWNNNPHFGFSDCKLKKFENNIWSTLDHSVCLWDIGGAKPSKVCKT